VLIGVIRPREVRTIEVSGETLDELKAAVEAQLPEGWEIVAVPATMTAGTTLPTSTATIANQRGVTEIEAPDITALRAEVPEGWQLVSVRTRD
jgi:hypothetical protein